MKNPVKLGGGSPAVNVKNSVYSMATTNGLDADITMYGDIYEQKPTDSWGDPVDGQFITLDEFMEDLQRVEKCKSITIHMHSYGGDCGVSMLIHNKLRDMADSGVSLTCIVDGVAMSGGSIIMAACDTVKVHPSSLVMIHNCWSQLWGGYNAADLRAQATQMDAWDKAMVEIYERKTGLSSTVIKHMMEQTTYMTGREAHEKGFADELLDDDGSLSLAASADGRSLFVAGRQIHLVPGMFAPDSIPTVDPEAKKKATEETNKNKPEDSGSDEGGNPMAKTIEELRTEYPDLTAQVETEAKAAAKTDAEAAERARIKEIDEVASLFPADMVTEAKYGETACSAQELAFRAAKKAAADGTAFMTAMNADAKASGAEDVGTADADTEDDKPVSTLAEAQSQIAALLGKQKKED